MVAPAIAAIGTGLTSAFSMAGEAIKTEAYSIIANLISVIKVVVMYIYNWMIKFWSWFAENPIGGVTLLANMWVLAS